MRPRISASLRGEIRRRAEGRCEYCRKPEIASLYAHQIDHILHLKHDGISAIENLAWACFRCNVNKGSDISGYDPITGELTPLYDPRNLQWEDHFELDGALIKGKTSVGRVTVSVLQFNHPDNIKTRRHLINIGLY